MSTLRQTVYNSVLSLHRKLGKEWIPLKEIYKEVDRVRDVGINNGGASVRAALEIHSSLSNAFSGTEEYILKEKGSGLYKSICYDQLKVIENLNIGEIFTHEQLMKMFKINSQMNIMESTALNCLVLIIEENNGEYVDSLVENGKIQYTGEGLIGDQTITKNNKILRDSKENELPLYLFSKDKNKKYIFEGQVELYDKPYQLLEKDKNGNHRLVWKFPLKVIYQKYDTHIIDKKYEDLIQEITKLENNYEISNHLNFQELVYKEGKINIRKYRRSGNKVKRSRKPDYIADEIVKTKQGIINEEYIYKIEIDRLEQENAYDQIERMKKFFENKKENEGFDILSFELNNEGEYIEKFIEVKSTKGSESTPIDITVDEIEFAKKHIDNYYLYRIINSDSKDRYLKIVKGRDLLNDIDYSFIPTNFKIYSK